MIVLDTSAAVELLLALPLSREVEECLDDEDWQIVAPHFLVTEVLQVLRRRVVAGITPVEETNEALELLDAFNIRFYDHQLVSARVWELRENLSAYDATFVALAELLDATLVTSDVRLANAPGHAARIRLVG